MPSTIETTTVRWSVRKDWPAIHRVERGLPGRWRDHDFEAAMEDRATVPKIAVHEGVVVGHIVYAIHDRQLNLLRIAVAEDCQRCGFGSRLIEELVCSALRGGRERIHVLVPERNVGAQLFFRYQGFDAVDIVRGDEEDSYLMRRNVRVRRESECPDCRESIVRCRCGGN